MSTYIRKYFYLKLNSTTKKRDIFDKNPPFNLVFLSKRIDWQFFLKKDPKIIDLWLWNDMWLHAFYRYCKIFSNLKNREKIHLNVVELLTQARAEIFDQVLSLKRHGLGTITYRTRVNPPRAQSRYFHCIRMLKISMFQLKKVKILQNFSVWNISFPLFPFRVIVITLFL